MRVLLLIGLLTIINSYSIVAQQTIKFDDVTTKRLRELQQQEETRRKMQSQMRITKSTSEIKLPVHSSSSEAGKCKLDSEQMKQFANSVDASRGKAGLLQMPVLVNQARQIDKQCELQKVPTAFQKKPEPNAMHFGEKK